MGDRDKEGSYIYCCYCVEGDWRINVRYIRDVHSLEGYKLEVVIDNGNCVILDFEERLETIRFACLRDHAVFNDVTTNGNFIFWRNCVELSISEVFEMVQK